MERQEDIKYITLNIRRRVFKHTLNNNGGYLNQACSSAELLATLYIPNVQHLLINGLMLRDNSTI
ncbi:MAG: hypothetical protein SVR94_19855 [Pseudomonadota bacterium]|nr:hypothetical protein [Pseudomonadota bacterium]